MKTKIWAMSLVLFCTGLTTLAQFLWKTGTVNLSIYNPWIWAGFLSYGIAAVLLIVALKGGELSVLYPIVATSFVWVTLVSWFVFKEFIGINKWVGVIAIIGGISLIGVGAE